ncbi:hypothetical protein WJX81_003746 [Elliptochloris bilobata]|uniref:Uncharacterized protein n=1 Tax=Elliptochloris bilobata TaxID=381761 RepID=A0AAW1RIH5_9CHLO
MDENISDNVVAAAKGRKRASKSPIVRLHLSLSDSGAPAPPEVIKRITKAYEVVEVDGFVFKRKRSVAGTRPSAVAAPAASGPSVHPPAPTSPHAAPCAGPSAGAMKPPEQQQAVGPLVDREPSAEAAEAAAAALAALPGGGGAESARLLAVFELLAQGQAAAAASAEGGETVAVAALRAALDTVLGGVRSALADGTLQCAEERGDGAAAAAAAAEGHKAELRARLAALQQEEAEWHEVLQKNGGLVQQLAAATAGAAAADAALSTRAAEQDGAAAATTLAAAPAADSSRPSAAAPAADAAEAAVAAPIAPAEGEAAAALALRRAQTDAHRMLTIQVEGLCAMVSGVEDLVATAERECGRMQADYHHQKFAMFEHVDSPARLIKEILGRGRGKAHARP